MSIEYTRVAEDPYDGVMKLWEYTQKSDNPSGNVYVFKSTRSNDHITYDSMREILLELAKTVNLPELNRIGWHSCRKTRADQEFVQTAGGDLPSVRQILGHTEKSKSTKLYLSHRPAPKS